MTLRSLLPLAIAIACLGPVAATASTQKFQDEICEKATSAGQHLNALVDSTNVLTPELMTAAKQMVDVYEDCVSGYDRDVYGNGGHGGDQYGHSDALLVHRLYSRLALARSLQRVGMYDVYGKDFDDARAAYTEAIARIDQMKPMIGGQSVTGTSSADLLAKSEALKVDVQAALAQLPPAAIGSASPAPIASAAASPLATK